MFKIKLARLLVKIFKSNQYAPFTFLFIDLLYHIFKRLKLAEVSRFFNKTNLNYRPKV